MSRIYIVGAGGIGSVVAANLAKGGIEVTVIDPWLEHVNVINNHGLTLESPSGNFTVTNMKAYNFNDIDILPRNPDFIMLSVKSYETVSVLQRIIKPIISDNTLVVSLQNGINEENISNIVGASRTIGAIVRMDGALLGPGRVSKTNRRGSLIIGELNGEISEKVKSVSKILQHVADVYITDNIYGELWSKLTVNCMLNAACAITNLGAKDLILNEKGRTLAISLAKETVNVALAKEVTLDKKVLWGFEPEAFLEKPGSITYENIEQKLIEEFGPHSTLRPSMLQDVLKGRRTEIDFMNGWISVKGKEAGIPTPISDKIVELVKQIENGKIYSGVENLNQVLVSTDELA